MEYITIVANRDAYYPSDVGRTLTVGDLIEALKEYHSGLPIVISNDNGYTYGRLSEVSIRRIWVEEERDEEEDAD